MSGISVNNPVDLTLGEDYAQKLDTQVTVIDLGSESESADEDDIGKDSARPTSLQIGKGFVPVHANIENTRSDDSFDFPGSDADAFYETECILQMRALFPNIAQDYVSQMYRDAMRRGVHLAERDMWVAYEVAGHASYPRQSDRKRRKGSDVDDEEHKGPGPVKRRAKDGIKAATRHDRLAFSILRQDFPQSSASVITTTLQHKATFEEAYLFLLGREEVRELIPRSDLSNSAIARMADRAERDRRAAAAEARLLRAQKGQQEIQAEASEPRHHHRGPAAASQALNGPEKRPEKTAAAAAAAVARTQPETYGTGRLALDMEQVDEDHESSDLEDYPASVSVRSAAQNKRIMTQPSTPAPRRQQSSARPQQPPQKHESRRPQRPAQPVAARQPQAAVRPTAVRQPTANTAAAQVITQALPTSQNSNGEQECGCCFTDSLIHEMIRCNGVEAHYFCKECMQNYVKSQVGEGKAQVKCMDRSTCDATFSRSALKEALDNKTFQLLERQQQAEALRVAEIDGLEECPFCDWKAVLDSVDDMPEFWCQNRDCGRVSCRKCKKEMHEGKSCEETKKETKTDVRHAIEEAMTDALMRSCNKCKIKFVKDYGCNKMTCFRCGNIQCYVCNQSVDNYAHFGTVCPPYDNTEERHHKEVEDAKKAVIEKLRKENPNLDPKDLEIRVSDEVKQEENRKRQLGERNIPPFMRMIQGGAGPPPRIPGFGPLDMEGGVVQDRLMRGRRQGDGEAFGGRRFGGGGFGERDFGGGGFGGGGFVGGGFGGGFGDGGFGGQAFGAPDNYGGGFPRANPYDPYGGMGGGMFGRGYIPPYQHPRMRRQQMPRIPQRGFGFGENDDDGWEQIPPHILNPGGAGLAGRAGRRTAGAGGEEDGVPPADIPFDNPAELDRQEREAQEAMRRALNAGQLGIDPLHEAQNAGQGARTGNAGNTGGTGNGRSAGAFDAAEALGGAEAGELAGRQQAQQRQGTQGAQRGNRAPAWR